MAMELQRPTAALKAMDLQLKLTGVIRDTRAGLYAGSPDDDLSKAFFDPREDEDPDFNPASYPASTEAEVSIPEPDEPAEPEDGHTAPGGKVQLITFAASYPPSSSPPPLDVGRVSTPGHGLRSATLSGRDYPIRRRGEARRPLPPTAPGFQK